MKNRKEFIECIYETGKSGFNRTCFKSYRRFHTCKEKEIDILFDILEKSGNLYVDENGKRHIDGVVDEKSELYELDVCALMISLIVIGKFRKSSVKFEERIKEYCKKNFFHKGTVTDAFMAFSYRWTNRLIYFYKMAHVIIRFGGACDMCALFDDVLDWDKEGSDKLKWYRYSLGLYISILIKSVNWHEGQRKENYG